MPGAKARTLALSMLLACSLASQTVQFVFTADAHFGLVKQSFRGAANVNAETVNAALVDGINSLPQLTLPCDGGVGAGQPVGAIDFVVEGGDIATRQEKGIQAATMSWGQFKTTYLDALRVTGGSGRRAPLFLIPGNHDVSNAIGFFKPLRPAIDATAMVEMWNRMMAPRTPVTEAAFAYPRNAIHYSRTFGGIHFLFVNVWPDQTERAWIQEDLRQIEPSTPVILFAHDPPSVPTEHLTNPKGQHDLNARDRFENLLPQSARETDVTEPSLFEQQELTAFLEDHRNITAWFHGHLNWNEGYDWTGTDGRLSLHTFRVDSPMKGKKSSKDERMLSFQLATIDVALRRMTVRECLWNAEPSNPAAPVVFGKTITVPLEPRPAN